MLYANGDSKNIGGLAAALELFGVPQEDLAVFDEFMDMNKPMDMSLLKGVKRIDLRGAIDWKRVDAIRKAIKKELLSPTNADKINRYVNFIYAVGGTMCWRLLNGVAGEETERNFFSRGLKAGHADDGKAIAYAIRAVFAALQNNLFYHPEKEDIDTCLRAAELTDEDNISGRALLLIYALDQMEQGDERAKKALTLAHKVIAFSKVNVIEAKAQEYCLTLMAECAYFDKHYLDTLATTLKALDSIYANRTLINYLSNMKIDSKRIYEVIEEEPSIVTPDYILNIRGKVWHKQKLAKEYTDVYVKAIKQCSEPLHAKELEDALIQSGAEYDKKAFNIQNKTRRRVMEEISAQYDHGEIIREYICGQRALADALAEIGKKKIGYTKKQSELDYYTAFGRDDFIARAVTVMMLADIDYGRFYRVKEYTGFVVNSEEGIKEAIDMMCESGADLTQSLDAVGLCIDDMYSEKEKCTAAAIDEFDKRRQGLKGVELKKLCATARVLYAKAIGRHPNEFKSEILALADDGSKAVRAEVSEILCNHKGWADDIVALLKAKKGAKRELAIEVISKQGAEAYMGALGEAFEAEKSEKIRAKIGALIGAAVEGSSTAEISLEQQLEKLAKSSKTGKLSFLFDRPFGPVYKTDGSEAGEDILRALVMCYASFTQPQRSKLADDIAAELDKKALENFAAEVFGRWCDNGAQAKQKCLLYFCACHGGLPMVREFMHSIKQWAENMRGAIAAEAVKAMALDGSSEALMNVDNMSRKFKNKQVRAAAGDAMMNAAEALGLTTEELADKIVPDLGFDENKCREFDYGARQFKVYIAPTLELEIFSGEKKVKNLPKPGANDDPDKSKAAYDEFKELKKQLKNVITAQRARLEYVLMCDRRWSQQKWNELFVKNAVMNCFAIGLIWGVYEGSELKATFRYMDDGSFTDMEGDEYTLPEGAQIGLVHPIELNKEQLDGWREQLEDFEITQPFEQLDRAVYLPEEGELKANKLTRFDNIELNSLTLINKMTKLGWYKGQAEDAGWFFYFYRDDIARRVRNADGTQTKEGFGVMLTFSGASIVVYDFEGEEVTTEKLIFYKAGSQPYYYNKEEKGFLRISDVSRRYFSEIVLQLNDALGKKAKDEE